MIYVNRNAAKLIVAAEAEAMQQAQVDDFDLYLQEE